MVIEELKFTWINMYRSQHELHCGSELVLGVLQVSRPNIDFADIRIAVLKGRSGCPSFFFLLIVSYWNWFTFIFIFLFMTQNVLMIQQYILNLCVTFLFVRSMQRNAKPTFRKPSWLPTVMFYYIRNFAITWQFGWQLSTSFGKHTSKHCKLSHRTGRGLA